MSNGLKMNLPIKTSLPFFAYGIFKPGQLCFSRISALVERIIKCNVKGTLKERDGIPLLALGSENVSIQGYLIYL